MRVCVGFNTPLHIIGHFGDESFWAIICTGIDNQKQSNTTLHTPETQKRNRKKTALANNLHPDLVRLLRPPVRKRSGPYSYSPEPTRGNRKKDEIVFVLQIS